MKKKEDEDTLKNTDTHIYYDRQKMRTQHYDHEGQNILDAYTLVSGQFMTKMNVSTMIQKVIENI